MRALLRLGLLAFCGGALATRAFAAVPGGDATNPGAAPDEHQKDDSEATKMKAELAHVKDVINAAKKPEDLDPILFDLQKYQNEGYQGENQNLYQQLNSAMEFTRLWQNYLSHVAANDDQQARNDLNALTQNNYGAGLIPRSRLLRLLQNPLPEASAQNTPAATPPTPPQAQKIIDDITTLDALEPALNKLAELSQNDPLAREYAQHLAPLVEAYNDLRQGLPTNVNINFMGDVTGAGVSAKANNLVLKFILQHYFDSYQGAPPGDNETAAAYATRVKNDALAGQDWALLKKALTVDAFMFRNIAGAGGTPDNETAGLDELIAGINQQKAGQYALAVASFQGALKAPNLDIPAKFIGEQLDSIKRDHPADYDLGMQSFLTPQVASPYPYPGMNPAYNAMMNQRFRQGLPGYPVTPGGMPAQPNPVLSIPAAQPSVPPPAPASTNAPPATK